MVFDGKPSGSEAVKENSNGLRGNIAAELADTAKPDVTDETYELLKFHGTYFGHNRDTATSRKKAGLEKEYEFMVRSRIPGGMLNAEQYLAMEEVADKFANGAMRITTRQVFQFHVVLKNNLKNNIAAINHALLSTQSGCGDVVRNVTSSAAPTNSPKHKKIREDVEKIATFVRPKTKAYKEIWLDEKDDSIKEREVDEQGREVDPLYGTNYMPRKFKIGIIIPEDNSIDVFTHDLGIVQIWEGDNFKGYNIMLGGGMGMKHEPGAKWEEKKTYPRIATDIAFVGVDDLIPAVEAAVRLQRDHGDRSDRQHARLKYVVQEKGVELTKKTYEEYFRKAGGKEFKEPVKGIKYEIHSHMGWHDQGDGKLFLGVPVASGRIVDYDKPHPTGYTAAGSEKYKNARFKSGLKAVVSKFKPDIILTATEEIIFYNIDPKNKTEMEAMLRSYGIPLADSFTNMQKHFMTCVSLPTCAKALAEAERVQFQISDSVQAALDKTGISNERMAVRVTGCPNGCARPFVGDIGIVGRMPDHYLIFVGGDFEGTRLNRPIFDKVPTGDIGKALEPMFKLFKEKKNAGEGFGDFCNRFGIEAVKAEAIKSLAPQHKWAA